MKTIGEQIKYYRNKKGLTMQELAEKIGVTSKQVINDYESGRYEPSKPILLKIAETLNCEYIQTLKPLK